LHKITLLALSLLWLIFFTGCEDKKPDQASIPVENTTQVITPKTKNIYEPTPPKLKKAPHHNDEAKEIMLNKDTFELFNQTNQKVQVKLQEKDLIFDTPQKPIVLMQLFSTWCAPCIGEIKYLNALHTANQDDLFISALLTRDTIDAPTLQAFISTHQIEYTVFKSAPGYETAKEIALKLGYSELFPIPLLILYVNGKYYTHYEGSVPVEMVKYDIRQAQKKLKNK